MKAFISDQLRRPSGLFGRWVMTRTLDRVNRPLIQATLDRLELKRDTRFLDLGFGGGLSLQIASRRIQTAPLFGVDYSADVLRHAHRRFRKQVHSGTFVLLQADAADVPLRERMFDRVCTVNTIYFWSAPQRAAAELRRLLTPGGLVAIGYTGAEKMARGGGPGPGFTPYAPPQVETLLDGAGFEAIRTDALVSGSSEGDFVTLARRPAERG